MVNLHGPVGRLGDQQRRQLRQTLPDQPRQPLPLLLIALGVFGGVVAFGFIGIFIGPPVLALGLTLVRLWTAAPPAETEAAPGTAPRP